MAHIETTAITGLAIPAAFGAVVGAVASTVVVLVVWRIRSRLRRARLAAMPATSPAARASTSVNGGSLKPVRRSIPERTRHEVWRRDQGRCVDCQGRENLEFDHIIPVSRGGANTTRNIELRCEACNGRKGARI